MFSDFYAKLSGVIKHSSIASIHPSGEKRSRQKILYPESENYTSVFRSAFLPISFTNKDGNLFLLVMSIKRLRIVDLTFFESKDDVGMKGAI